METAFFVLLLLVVWISLYNHISKATANIDSLKKEIASLRKQLENRTVEEKENAVSLAKPSEEEYHIPILSVEVRQDEVTPKPEMKQPRPEPRKASDIIPQEISKKKHRPVNYEKFIGENLFGKIGILILVIGMGLFVKYAIDKDWINEVFRTVLGFVVGGGLLLISLKLKKTYRAFSSLLAGGAFAIFYVTVAMAYHYYGLFSQVTAFVILVVLTILMSVLSAFYNRRELAIIALVGGFISPFLVSNGMGSYFVLFVYVTILNLGMFGLSICKKWGELPIVSFVASYLILLGYSSAGDLDVAGFAQLVHLLLFATFFFLIFLLSVVMITRSDSRKINQLLMAVVVLNNFLYLFFCLWFLREMQLEQNIKGAFTLFIALVNVAIAFIINRRKVENSLLYPTLIGLALAFVSITIPIQLDGTFITLLWACEMVIVLWLFTKWRIRVYEYFVAILFFLTNVSYWMDIETLLDSGVRQTLFANGMFTTGVSVGISFLLVAWLLFREKDLFTTTSVWKYSPCNAMALLDGSAVLYMAFMIEFARNIDDWYLSQGLMLAFTAATLFILLLVMRKRFSVERYFRWYAFSLLLPVCWYMYVFFGYYARWTALQALGWLTVGIIAAHIYWLAREYYAVFNFRSKTANRMTVYVSILSTVLLSLAVRSLLCQLSLSDETNAGFSISLAIAGFVEMAIGMRLHLKSLRMVSLSTFGIVLLKLVVVDLWLLPTIGKIIIFIILGIILLLLSFLYQKLKKVLFEEDRGEEKEF